MGDFWSDESRLEGSEKVHASPCGKFELVVTRHKTGPGTWDYSKGVIQRTDAPRREGEKEAIYQYRRRVAVVRRNYGAFPFAWAMRDGQTYLFFGADYQGYGVINCETCDRLDWLPGAAARGAGFCWASIEWKPELPDRLHVCGCIWGGPYENVVYDITEIMRLPYPEISREPDPSEIDDDEEGEETEAA